MQFITTETDPHKSNNTAFNGFQMDNLKNKI